LLHPATDVEKADPTSDGSGYADEAQDSVRNHAGFVVAAGTDEHSDGEDDAENGAAYSTSTS